MMKRTWVVLAMLVLGVGGVGCGEDTEDPEDTITEATWDDLDFEGRQEHMAQVVMPEMQQVFAGFDADTAGNFQCATCHGADLAGGTFVMPGNITVLSAEELNTFTFEGEGRQEIANAMASQVVPAMAQLVDQEPFNPETGAGTIGCATCHPIQ